ncbi:MAG: signal peptide peptidase SppA [Candidatus Neomarinimicrobiota bacterium]
MKYNVVLFLLITTAASGQVEIAAPNRSVAIIDDAGSLVLNPAGLGIGRGENMLILGRSDMGAGNSVATHASFYFQTSHLGLGLTAARYGRNYFHWGSAQHLGYGIYLGDAFHFSSEGLEALDMGVLYRGIPHLSAGIMWKNLWSRLRDGREDQLAGFGLALRPLGNRFTVAYDHLFAFPASFTSDGRDLGGTAQVEAEILDGLKLFASYNLETEGIQIGFGIGFGELSVETYHDLAESDYVANLAGIQTSSEIRRAIFRERAPTYVELSFERPLSDSPTPRVFFGPKTLVLKDLTDAINEMAKNQEIDGIILKPDLYVTGMGMMEEVMRALLDFKESGKAIYAFMDMGGDLAYAMATIADSIYLNTGGVLMVDGLAFGVGFLKGLFDKIGVEAQFYRRGDYKTAAEPFTRDSLTETSREAYEAVLADVHSVFSRMIMQGRGWSREKLEEVFDKALFTPQMALEAGLVDGLFHPDQIETRMEEVTGEEKVRIVRAARRPRQWAYDWEPSVTSKIALIYAEGPIIPGKSEPSPFGGGKIIGSVTTGRAIKSAREDKSVKAIVMRVNSPGGSVLASEDIWREVHRTTHPDSADMENRKPFIISMSDVAGSGGYYISCAADTIVADSGTITGSIGVLSGKLSFAGLFEKIGYSIDVVKEQPHAEQFSSHRPFSDEEGQRMQALVDGYYEQFLSRVSEGRNISRDEVDVIAQGRIWSGADAVEIGLVDELGGLDRALEIACDAAGLKRDKYQLKVYKGVEEVKFTVPLDSRSDLLRLMEAFETDIPVTWILDRAKLIHDEPFLFLMEEELIPKD